MTLRHSAEAMVSRLATHRIFDFRLAIFVAKLRWLVTVVINHLCRALVKQLRAKQPFRRDTARQRLASQLMRRLYWLQLRFGEASQPLPGRAARWAALGLFYRRLRFPVRQYFGNGITVAPSNPSAALRSTVSNNACRENGSFFPAPSGDRKTPDWILATSSGEAVMSNQERSAE